MDAFAVNPIAGLPDRYTIVGSLGEGGQGHTYAAIDGSTGAEVAIKVFRLREASDWKPFDLFERECRVLRAIEHPQIPRYIEHGGDESTGVFWLVMQRVQGRSLQQMLDEGRRYTDAQLVGLLSQLLDVVSYLHDLNPPVYHRDIKPANVIVDTDGKACLVDYGGVREALFERGKSTVVGTFGYMAPEQLRGQAGPATDFYGLAATIAAIAAGQDASELPTPDNGLEIDLTQCMKPGRLRDTLAEMLRADPRHRMATAEAVRRSLESPAPQALAARTSAASLPARREREYQTVARSGDNSGRAGLPDMFVSLPWKARRGIMFGSVASTSLFLVLLGDVGGLALFPLFLVAVFAVATSITYGYYRGSRD